MTDAPTINISRMLRWNVVRRAEHEALVDQDRRWTYEELDRLVDANAQALVSAGAKRGDVVAILGRNSAEYVAEIFAIARIGAVLVPLNFRLHAKELCDIARRAEVRIVLSDVEFADKTRSMLRDGGVDSGFVHNDKAEDGDGLQSLTSLVASWDGKVFPDAEVALDDVQRVLFTSGTTSLPKGVIHTYANVVFNQLGQLLELELTPQDRLLISAPLFHVSGLEAPGIHALAVGATMVLTRSYAGSDVIELCDRERITGFVLAAQILYEILDLPDLSARDVSALRYCIFGGVPPSVRRRFGEAFPGVRLIDTFGMTELTNGGAYMDQRHEWSKMGACGAAFPYMDLRIVDRDGAEVTDGVVGEIVARGPKVSPGYWKDEAATSASRRNGWFHTGDMASKDAEGHIWFASREKDMIRSGGENVASAEIEQAIAEHPAVAEVAVIGIPDPKWDEVPKAFVIKKQGHSLSSVELLQFCRERLASFKVPKEVEFRDVLPRNDSGKVLKRELRGETSP